MLIFLLRRLCSSENDNLFSSDLKRSRVQEAELLAIRDVVDGLPYLELGVKYFYIADKVERLGVRSVDRGIGLE